MRSRLSARLGRGILGFARGRPRCPAAARVAPRPDKASPHCTPLAVCASGLRYCRQRVQGAEVGCRGREGGREGACGRVGWRVAMCKFTCGSPTFHTEIARSPEMPCDRGTAVCVTGGSFRAAWLRGFGPLLTVRVARRASSSDWWGVGGISVHTRRTALQRRLTHPCLPLGETAPKTSPRPP